MAGRLGVRPTRRLGQNFVVEQGTVRRIAALAAPRDGDVVLEVGPGLGSLTLALLKAAAGSDARLVAVEIDPAMAAVLPATVAERDRPAFTRYVSAGGWRDVRDTARSRLPVDGRERMPW